MSMIAPAAIQGIYDQTKKLVPAAVLLGITGDARHVADGGYHISREDLIAAHMTGDYSIQRAADKLGDPANSSAIDIGFGGYGVPLVKLVGQRMLAAGRAKDRRVVGCLREFYCCGPSDSNSDVIGWDFVADAPATTSDLSHRGHLHMSITREFSNDPAALAGIADVIAGIPIAQEDDMTPADWTKLEGLIAPLAADLAALRAEFTEPTAKGTRVGESLDTIVAQVVGRHVDPLAAQLATVATDVAAIKSKAGA